MAIRLEKDYHLELEMARVWDAINDPDTLASILPNCESLETISENEYEAQVSRRVCYPLRPGANLSSHHLAGLA